MKEWMIYAGLLILISGTALFLMMFSAKRWNKQIDCYFRKRKLIFHLFLEWILTLVGVVFFLILADSVGYYQSVNYLAFIAAWLTGTVDVIYIFRMLRMHKDRIENIFLILMIPIGIVFMFFLFPDFIPDEQSHFMKAYLTSTFEFSGTYAGNIYGEYQTKGITSFHELLQLFYFGADTTLNTGFSEACSYNFLVYIIPALGLLIGRIFHLSIYFCYYIGRMLNFGVFLFFGYQAIKIVPKYKHLLLAFYFNPMMVHLGISYSADVVVNSICIFAVAYFVYLFCKEEISSYDVIVVMALIAGILVSKYLYFSVFGCYLILIPKLFKMPRKNWILFAGGVFVAGMMFYVAMKINSNIDPVPSQALYLEQANVDMGKQIEWLKESPIRLLQMYAATFRQSIGYYLRSFVSYLGWLDIMINPFSYYYFYCFIFAAASMGSVNLKPFNRVWLMTLGFFVSALVVLGLYLQWSGVGTLVAAGVQGRYFIPAAILLLLSVSNTLLEKWKFKTEFCIVSVLLIQLPVMIDLFRYAYTLSYLAG